MTNVRIKRILSNKLKPFKQKIIETVDEEIKLIAHLKRVRDGESLAESGLDKWTSEGLGKGESLLP